MAAHTKVWYLERFRLFDGLTAEQKAAISKRADMLEVPRGQPIYLAGDPSHEIFLLKSGVVKISITKNGNAEAILAFLHAGDIFGELAIIDESPRDHIAVAHEDTVLCALERDALMEVVREAPALGYEITKLMGLRLRRLRTRVEELLCKSAHARIAHTLVDLATAHGIRDDAGVLIPLRLSQGDLGNLVGLARETVNIVLQDFKERGLVEVDHQRIRVRDVETLRTATH